MDGNSRRANCDPVMEIKDFLAVELRFLRERQKGLPYILIETNAFPVNYNHFLATECAKNIFPKM